MYTDAVNLDGLPNEVQSDLGGENIEVWRYMIEHSSNEAVVTGSSTHNERIEHLWRDVYRVGVPFADTFRELAKTDLDPLNEVDIFCLHYIYLPRINTVLDEFVECWNNHYQQQKALHLTNSFYWTGYDTTAATANNESKHPVCTLSYRSWGSSSNWVSTLQAQMQVVNPLRSSGNFGIVGQHLSRGCTLCNYFSHNLIKTHKIFYTSNVPFGKGVEGGGGGVNLTSSSYFITCPLRATPNTDYNQYFIMLPKYVTGYTFILCYTLYCHSDWKGTSTECHAYILLLLSSSCTL